MSGIALVLALLLIWIDTEGAKMGERIATIASVKELYLFYNLFITCGMDHINMSLS